MSISSSDKSEESKVPVLDVDIWEVFLLFSFVMFHDIESLLLSSLSDILFNLSGLLLLPLLSVFLFSSTFC